jgi:DNA repair protein RecO (recombination protein O)
MPRESSYQAIIIKKQPFNEADEIITLFTAEAGKLRALAKSVKLGTSKLQQSLQPIFLNRIQLAGNNSLPKVIGAQTINPFPLLHAESSRVNVWFVVAELLNKALPDEQVNQRLFELVADYLDFLDSQVIAESDLAASLVKFKIKFMELIGLQIHAPTGGEDQIGILFSANRGGFYMGQSASDSRAVSPAAWRSFNALHSIPFVEIGNEPIDISQLHELVNEFISYQLEREIKAEKFL